MKGIVFTEFLEFVARDWGEDMVDDIIEDCDLPSGGAYTAVGTYDHTEIAALCRAFGARTDQAPYDILRNYGRYLGNRFAKLYPVFFEIRETLFSFLDSVDQHIHSEVRKLYHGAEMPEFRSRFVDGSTMVLEYRSSRHLQSLAEGLIIGAADYYRETVTVDSREGRDRNGEYVELTIGRV